MKKITQDIHKKSKNPRKRALRESQRHALLKKISKRFLRDFFGVAENDIYEDFPLGEHIFDVIAYPKRHRFGAFELSIIAIECGNIKSDCVDCLKKINSMLDYVDMLIWVPYSIYYNPFTDILGSVYFQESDKDGKIKFSTEGFGLHKLPMRLSILEDEGGIWNIDTKENFISGLAFCKGETYHKLKKAGQKFLHG